MGRKTMTREGTNKGKKVGGLNRKKNTKDKLKRLQKKGVRKGCLLRRKGESEGGKGVWGWLDSEKGDL